MADSMIVVVMGDTEDRDNVPGQLCDEWPLDTSVDSHILLFLSEIVLPVLVNEPAQYPKLHQEDASRDAQLAKQERKKTHSPVHLLHKWQCYPALFLAMFVICSGG